MHEFYADGYTLEERLDMGLLDYEEYWAEVNHKRYYQPTFVHPDKVLNQSLSQEDEALMIELGIKDPCND